MSFVEDYLRQCEVELEQLRRDLKPLEAGEMHLRERHAGGPWVETTQKWIDHLKRTIGIYEGILARHKESR